MSRRAIVFFTGLILAALPATLAGQTTAEEKLRQHADSLSKLRAEREALESQMRQMQGRVRDLSEEVDNISQQAATTSRLVRALDSQLGAINLELNNSSASLVRAQDELAVKQADLRRRLSDIYRRGALHTLEVLFSAQSFTDLIVRYKYLNLQTIRDRAMVQRVAELKSGIETTLQSQERMRADVRVNLQEKERETERMRILEQQRKTALNQAQQSATSTQSRIVQLSQDERRLNTMISSIANEARGGRGAATPTGPSVFRQGAMLDWPIEGELLYRFGRVTGAGGTQTVRQGIAISAPRGASVRAVADGVVANTTSVPGYGRIIIIAHAAGDFSLYSSLDRITADSGAAVIRGQVIATVGTSDADLGPHLKFEVRLAANPSNAVDPLPFLKPRN